MYVRSKIGGEKKEKEEKKAEMKNESAHVLKLVW